MAKAKKTKVGKLSIADMRKLVNKKAGVTVAHDLGGSNPTEVKEWIPTGSRWLNSIICRGKYAGIPIGKTTEIAGLSASGKSYMAAQIAGNAQKMGIDVIYFDSESAVDPNFLANAGCDVENLLYIQAQSVEFVLETIEELLGSNENRMLFIWDSLAMTPAITDIEGDFNPLSSMAVKPRILSKGFAKLVVPIANSQSTLLILNQLKTNITMNIAEARLEPYFTPGGKAAIYAYSLRIWLTARRGKASFLYDDKGFRIGTEVKAKIKKSRFGSDARECTFKIMWAGEDVKIQDEESWLEAIKGSKHITNAGAWFTLKHEDGSEEKFQTVTWMKKLEEDKFRNRILQLMENEIILKFEKKEVDAKEFYDIDGEDTA
jgi:recombination protein RecA|tara:strand:- start:138 stop:1262 length:1125 start_codon:yes stop_codon:yes gene_type:complete